MRTYEVVFIAASNTAADDLTKLKANLEHIIEERGGKVSKFDDWGSRKLAYPIDKHNDGIYTVIYIDGTGREIAEVERRLRVTDFVIRYLTVRTDEDLKRAAKMKAKRKTAAAAPGSNPEVDPDDDDMMGDD